MNPKFKIGDKVRIKEWLQISPELREKWGSITLWNNQGEVGVIEKYKGIIDGEIAYDIMLSLSKYSQLVFEKELESIIKVGEQLIFDFIKEE